MRRLVIDPVTLVQLVGGSDEIKPAQQLVAPNSIRSQALDLLLQSVRIGRLSEREALQQHGRLTELKMRLLGDRVSRRTAWDIAMEHGWDSLKDAEYLAVTKLQADALVTVDPELVRKAAAVVPLAPFEELLAT